MFTPEFIEELFKPQELYSAKSARQIFDKLAHSSIMRLSVSSMNKLYDLMTMGFKYQLVACNHCGELLEVTLNHLMSVMQMVDSGPAQESVRRATELVTHRYAGMSGTDFCLLRQTLCTHLQDKRIKVSLFLQMVRFVGLLDVQSILVFAAGIAGAIKWRGGGNGEEGE
jgi:hypothetical protein